MTLVNYRSLFATFEGREAELRKVLRYLNYKQMFYRTDLLVHSMRLAWLLWSSRHELLRIFPEIDICKLFLLACVHDDPEILTGDLQSANKTVMSREAIADHEKNTLDACEALAKKYPVSVLDYPYGYLLFSSNKIDCLEARIMKCADKFEGFMEAVHEVAAGNHLFLKNNIDGAGMTLPTPFQYYEGFFRNLKPLEGVDLAKVAALEESVFWIKRFFVLPDLQALAGTGKKHTRETIMQLVSIPYYDEWKNCMLECPWALVPQSLTQVKE